MDLAARVALARERGAESRGLHADVDDAAAHLEGVMETTAADEPQALAAAQAVLAAIEHHELTGSDAGPDTDPAPEPDADDEPPPPDRPHRMPLGDGPRHQVSRGVDDGEQWG